MFTLPSSLQKLPTSPPTQVYHSKQRTLKKTVKNKTAHTNKKTKCQMKKPKKPKPSYLGSKYYVKLKQISFIS